MPSKFQNLILCFLAMQYLKVQTNTMISPLKRPFIFKVKERS